MIKITTKTNMKLKKPDELRDMYRNFFLHSPEGEVILQDLAHCAGMYNINADEGEEKLLFKEGRRALFMYIISYLDDHDENEEGRLANEVVMYS